MRERSTFVASRDWNPKSSGISAEMILFEFESYSKTSWVIWPGWWVLLVEVVFPVLPECRSDDVLDCYVSGRFTIEYREILLRADLLDDNLWFRGIVERVSLADPDLKYIASAPAVYDR
jgi:hypothetical protein